MKTPSPASVCGLILFAAARLCAQSVIQFSAVSYPVTEGVTEAAVLVQRAGGLDAVVRVDFMTVAETATSGADYREMTGTLTFGVGETNQVIAVPLLNDALIEPPETFQVILAHPGEGAVLGSRTNASVRINDNDRGLQIESSTYRAAEDGKAILLGVRRNDDGDFPVTVDFATEDGTALAGQDYRATSGTVTFAAGERLKQMPIEILNDGLKEPNEAFRLTLSNPTGGGILGSPTSATIHLVDNDPGVGFASPLLAINEHETVLKVRVLRGKDVDLGPFTVDISTADQSALGGLDYVATRSTLNFAAGEHAKTVEIQVRPDDLEEGTEVFRLILDNPSSGASLGAGTATVYLFDTTGWMPHLLDGVRVLAGQDVELTLGGAVPRALTNYFDLYPVEVSVNLKDWVPWALLQRTHAATNAPIWRDPQAAGETMRFYRTPGREFVTPYPKPPGPFPVGVVSRLVTDPTRRDRYPNLPGEARFMVTVWYPAVAEAGIPLARLEDELVVLNTSLGPLNRRYQFRSSAQPGVACADTGNPHPILLYSPGGTSFRTDLAERGPYLASHGYVVAAADPVDALVSVLPDGTVLRGQGLPPLSDRVRDLAAVLEELTRWNVGDPIFRGRLAVDNVAAAGWSYGGGAAGEFCRTDARCRAALVFEGYFQGSDLLLASGVGKPLLSMYASSLAGNATPLHNKATSDSIWFQIRSTDHESFSDYYWAVSPAGGRDAANIMNVYSLWFLDRHLKGGNAPMPDPANHPRVYNLQVK